jgi:polynucleotide 5'-kinase involved in rRNA processing
VAVDWADKIAQQLLSRDSIKAGVCLVLGASDTGKTTLAASLVKYAASSRPVAIVDADVGQSHIGPPAAVGWALVDSRKDLSKLPVSGINFVGDVNPTGRLLQLTTAILQCVQQASEAADITIIDTPGFIHGPAAAALWWTVQRILRPSSILAVQRSNELKDILSGFESLETKLELISSPEDISPKSPLARQKYRREKFAEYFRDSCVYNINLTNVAIQSGRNLSRDVPVHRLLALRDGKGVDMALGIVADWRYNENVVVVRAPKLDIEQIRCLVIGNVSIDVSMVS